MRLETQLVRAINRTLPKRVHHQSTTGTAQTGTPDQYYDGPWRELWIEYKLLVAMPRSGLVGFVDATKRGCYSPKQFEWMERRYTNSLHLPHGPNVFGIVGLPNRMAVIQRTPTEWREGTPVTQAILLKEVTEWLVTQSCGSQ